MKKIVIAMIAAVAFAGTALAADVMTFPASMGAVSFPHKMHQEKLKDCKVCHEKGPGKIEGFGKDWAHKTCKGCHADKQQGPTSCKGCHKK
jgi:opacity protein-like surface antigen